MVELPSPCGERWTSLTGGITLPEHEIMRVKTFLGGMNQDDLVYVERYGTLIGGFDDGEVVDRIVVVGSDGAGRRLRRQSFNDPPGKVLDDVASIYLCRGVDPRSDEEVRYVFLDCTDDKKPLLLCRRADFVSVFYTAKMGGTAGGIWKGSDLIDQEEWTSIDEPAYLFPPELLDSVIENTSLFLTGKFAELILSWGVPPRRGVLLHGKPGNGKTVLSRIAAKRAIGSGLNVVILDVDSLYSGVGDQLRIAASRSPVLIIIDDLDIYCGHRADEAQGSSVATGRQRFLAELLEFLDGVESVQGCVVLATTNAADQLDPALMRAGRLDVHLAVTGPPIDHRRTLLEREIFSKSAPTPNCLAAAEALEGCSYADVTELAKRYKISVVVKHKAIEMDQELLDITAREYAQEMGILETTKSGLSYKKAT